MLGGGGREHALAWKINESSRLTKLYVAPGNAGTALIAENVDLKVTDFEALAAFVESKAIDMLVVGPEDPLVEGVRDYFEADGRFEKLMIVDSRYVVIGSTNFNFRSMELSHELSLVIDSPEIARLLEEHVESDVRPVSFHLSLEEAERLEREEGSFLAYLFMYYGG